MNAIVSIAAAVLLINSFAPPGEEAVYGAVGGTLGTGAGVVTGLAFMLLVYFMNRNVLRRRMGRDRNREAESYGSVFRTIFFLVTPIIFTTFINNASTYLDSYIFSSIQDFTVSAEIRSPLPTENSATIICR